MCVDMCVFSMMEQKAVINDIKLGWIVLLALLELTSSTQLLVEAVDILNWDFFVQLN